jgi:hypothetical protein
MRDQPLTVEVFILRAGLHQSIMAQHREVT